MEIWVEGENRSDIKKAAAYALLTVGFFVLEMGSGAFVATLLLSVIFSMVSFIIMCTSLCNYLDFKLQPRRMSIKAITSLLE